MTIKFFVLFMSKLSGVEIPAINFLLLFQSDLAYEMEPRNETVQEIMNHYVEVETGLEVCCD